MVFLLPLACHMHYFVMSAGIQLLGIVEWTSTLAYPEPFTCDATEHLRWSSNACSCSWTPRLMTLGASLTSAASGGYG